MTITIKQIEEMSEDFTEDYLVTAELRDKFIKDVFDYVSNCCETEQEMYCFVDGYLWDFFG